jgi:hypothetical protein
LLAVINKSDPLVHRNWIIWVCYALVSAGFFLGPIVYSSYFSVIFSHDDLYWFLPFYKILYSGISTGALPIWNPYSHGGEPTLVPLLHLHLLDLPSLTTAYIGNLFDRDYIQMVFVDRQVRMFNCGLGITVFLCQWGRISARTAIDPLVAEKTPVERKTVPEDYTAERFFLLKRYDEIVRSGFSDHVVKSLLGVGLPILQLKEKGLVVDSALEWFGRSSDRDLMDARRETVVLEAVDNGLVVQDVPPACDDSSNNRESLRIGDSQNGEDDEIQIKEFRANYLRADVTSSQPKFLVFNSAYEKNWRAYLDGHYVRPFMGDGFSLAIAIGCGTHNVEFKYQPTLLLVALGLFNAIPLAGVIFLLFVSIRKANYNGWSKTTTTRI